MHHFVLDVKKSHQIVFFNFYYCVNSEDIFYSFCYFDSHYSSRFFLFSSLFFFFSGIGNRFQKQPKSEYSVQLGNRVKLVCNPPKGNPPPQISWMHDGIDINDAEQLNLNNFIETNNKKFIDGEGNLIIY